MNEIPEGPPKTLRLRKTVCWLLLAAGIGTLLLFFVLIMTEGLHTSDRQLWQLLAFAGMTSLISGFVLWKSYRIEPAAFSGFWHLSLSDLLIASFFTALLMTAFRAAWPQFFIPIGIIVTLLFGLGFAFCLLLATRKGCVKSRLKIICAIGYLLTSAGCMAIGMFFLVVLFVAIMDGNVKQALRTFGFLLNVFGEISPESDRPIYNIVRAGIVAIPIGILLLKWVESELKSRRLREPVPPSVRPD